MWLHRELRRERPPLRAWQLFFLLSFEECSIELTRYLFTASEVTERIVSSLRISEGSPAPPLAPLVPQEAAATLQLWPPFERAITERLTCGRDVYWSTGATPGQLNALGVTAAGDGRRGRQTARKPPRDRNQTHGDK